VVDNAAESRFASPPGWSTSSYSEDRFEDDYAYARPAGNKPPARFRVRIPSTDRYTVFARWPPNRGYNASTRIGVRTTSGVKWTRVNQQRNGGRWIRLGTYRMEAGDRYNVLVSRSSKSRGYVISDAVRVVEAPKSTTDGPATGRDVVREARTWLGVPYRYGGASRSGVDCSGLVLQVHKKLGKDLPRTAAEQYRLGTRVRSPRPGNLVFGNFNGGRSVEHVGIAAGDGRMINAPYPGMVVRYDEIYPQHTLGYKRLLPNG
jgi:cell wall-associated NlpC family hydrolase